MRRVFVTGQPGSGKSWLAVRLAAMTGIQAYHLDQMARPFGGEQGLRAAEGKLTRAQERESWIIDGFVYRDTVNWFRPADVIVILDRPLALRLIRVVLRKVLGNYAGREVEPPFVLARTIWSMLRNNGQSYRRLCRINQALAGEKDVVVLRSDRAMRDWLSALGPVPDLRPRAPRGPTVL